MIGIDSKKIKQKGITLIEALISTAIVGIGFIAVFQMVNYSVRSMDMSSERTKANYLVSMVAEDLIGDKNSLADPATSKTFKAKLLGGISDKKRIANAQKAGDKLIYLAIYAFPENCQIT